MKDIAQLEPALAKAIVGIFTDIDDTLTTGGKLPSEAYAALWQLHDAGLKVVPVTGRPAGWCDLIARQWPVDGVIGENGALAFYEDQGRLQNLVHPDVASPAVRQRLDLIRQAVLHEVEGSRVAQDQAYRLYDLAIDFREEAPDLGFAAAEQIRAIFARHGAQAKISSIHVNGWYGDYDKLAMVRLYAQKRWGVAMEEAKGRYFFCGDSPNDEPLFAYFDNSCGVYNVTQFAGMLKHSPRYLASRSGGAGFAEFTRTLLAARA